MKAKNSYQTQEIKPAFQCRKSYLNNKKYFITFGTQTESQLSKFQPTTTNLNRKINNFSKIQEFMDPSQPLKTYLILPHAKNIGIMLHCRA
jgi:hypothetical protein